MEPTLYTSLRKALEQKIYPKGENAKKAMIKRIKDYHVEDDQLVYKKKAKVPKGDDAIPIIWSYHTPKHQSIRKTYNAIQKKLLLAGHGKTN